jgi:hypothetical protein
LVTSAFGFAELIGERIDKLRRDGWEQKRFLKLPLKLQIIVVLSEDFWRPGGGRTR